MNKYSLYFNTTLYIFAALLLFGYGCTKQVYKAKGTPQSEKKEFKTSIPSVKSHFIKPEFDKLQNILSITPPAKIEKINVDTLNKKIEIRFSKEFSFIPFRNDDVKKIYSVIKKYFGSNFADYTYTAKTMGYTIDDLIPNYYRDSKSQYDTLRLPKTGLTLQRRSLKYNIPVVRNISKAYIPTEGLFNRNIALWPSHGWYFNNTTAKWEWQRPRLFQSVEDLITMAITVPYLTPMLENAGANVFIPRERDIQTNEVVVDNDTKSDAGKSYFEISRSNNYKWTSGNTPGFAVPKSPLLEKDNPFRNGTSRYTLADSVSSAEINWVPDIPEKGNYAVYISYPASENNVSDALYTVYHEGGKTEFFVNQTIGGGTWIYLGTFKFDSGINPLSGKVTLENKSKEGKTGKIVSADAVRFGGGMGIVSRGGMKSERPKFAEASRYYLQYAGMPDSLVYDLNDGKDDYEDDYQDRGEYVNYLIGSPYGPNKNRNAEGLGIPIDLSLALHTDAGISNTDTTFGTLSIYSVRSADSTNVFPDGVSRLANRDLADIVQTQVVKDIRSLFDPGWKRRPLRDAVYSEAYRPNVPSVLLEMLSHQNLLDMKFMQDPRFRFTVSRAIYKAILKFIASENRTDYIVQPLPVDHFQAILNVDGNADLKWKPIQDPLERTASPDAYVVYTRLNDGGFDNGILTDKPEIEIRNLKPGVIYSFKVTAVNKGGESFPSEILSVCKVNNKKPVLIINAFDRICAPAATESKTFSGFVNLVDAGVPDKYDLSFTGLQYNFDPKSEFSSNDVPGHGASYADYETKIIAGNTFDYPFIHGKSIMECGYSFCSASDEAVWDKDVSLNDYKMIDVIFGEEKETSWQRKSMDSLFGKQFKTFPDKFRTVISDYCDNGGNLFISGSYIGSDLIYGKKQNSTDVKFANTVLKIGHGGDHASKDGKVISSKKSIFNKNFSLTFNTKLNSKIYTVGNPDALTPSGGSHTVLNYEGSKLSAAVAFKKKYGIVVFGFPFETINTQNTRDYIMKNIFKYFKMNPDENETVARNR